MPVRRILCHRNLIKGCAISEPRKRNLHTGRVFFLQTC
jgi:hypothetical protein